MTIIKNYFTLAEIKKRNKVFSKSGDICHNNDPTLETINIGWHFHSCQVKEDISEEISSEYDEKESSYDKTSLDNENSFELHEVEQYDTGNNKELEYNEKLEFKKFVNCSESFLIYSQIISSQRMTMRLSHKPSS